MNNYNKIKQMTVDEMAILLDTECRCEYCIYNGTDCNDEYCEDGIKQYLLQEVEE